MQGPASQNSGSTVFDSSVLRTYQPAMLAQQPVHNDIVEISSDEDGDAEGEQPRLSDGAQPWAYLKRPNMNFNEFNLDGRGNSHDLMHFTESVSPKRRKLESNEENAELPQELLEFTSVILSAHPDQFQHKTINTGSSNDGTNLVRDSISHKGRPVERGLWVETVARGSEDLAVTPEAGSSEPAELPPYYYDAKLETQMYRGPGYEKFPIVLGTISEHRTFCERWDRKQQKMLKLRRPLRTNFSQIDPYLSDDNDDDISVITFGEDEVEEDVRPEDATGTELVCLERILEVLPDVNRSFALGKIRGYSQSFKFEPGEDIQVQPSSAEIVAGILDLTEYPKEKRLDEAALADLQDIGVTIQCQESDPQIRSYQKDAVCLLAGQFAYVPTHFIHKTVQEKVSMSESFRHIHQLEIDYQTLNPHDRPYRRPHEPRVSVEKKYSPKDGDVRNQDLWDNLVNELQATKQQLERERLHAAREKEREARETANMEEHKARGDVVECKCCFDDETPTNRTVRCKGPEMHAFCFSCVLRLAENQIGSMKHEMNCMDSSGCKERLSSMDVEQAVSAKLREKLASYQQQSELKEAGIDGLEQCSFCDFQAICDPIEEDPTFRCQNPECRRVSCRKCHEKDHHPKNCEEAKKDKGLSARHQVEEARSEAMIRLCPQCKVKIVKESGCNKMRCSQCAGLMCYVCKTDISHHRDNGYEHFNKRNATCKLYDRDYHRHDREADEAEKEAIRRARADNADLDEKQLQVGTGTSKADKGKRKKPVGAPLFPVRRAYGGAAEVAALIAERGNGFWDVAGPPQPYHPRPRAVIEPPWEDQRRLIPMGGMAGYGAAAVGRPAPAPALAPAPVQFPHGLGADYAGGALLRLGVEGLYQAAANEAMGPAAGNYNDNLEQLARMPRWFSQGAGGQGADPAGNPGTHHNMMYRPTVYVGEQAMRHGLEHQAGMAVPNAPHIRRAYGDDAHANRPPDQPGPGAARW